MYNMYLMQELEKETLVLKFKELPDEIEIKFSNNNKKYNVLALGDIISIGEKGLKTFNIKSFFPSDEAQVDKKTIETMINNKCPMRFILTKSSSESLYTGDINIPVVIDELTTKESGGEVGDIYYTVKFTEYRQYKAKVV